jgi:hypothetical protein
LAGGPGLRRLRTALAEHVRLVGGQAALAADQEGAERLVIGLGLLALLGRQLGEDALAALAEPDRPSPVAVDLRLLLGAGDLGVDAVDLFIDRVDLGLDVLRPLLAGVGVEQVAGLGRLRGALVPERFDVHRHSFPSMKNPAEAGLARRPGDRRRVGGRLGGGRPIVEAETGEHALAPRCRPASVR